MNTVLRVLNEKSKVKLKIQQNSDIQVLFLFFFKS